MAWGAWSQTFSPEVWSASQWGTKYYSINLNWRYRQDIAANQTQVEMISLRFNTLTSARGIHAATIHGRCSLANNDSAEKTCSNNMPSPPGSVTLAVNHTVTVTHNTDGSWPGHQVAWMLWVTGSGDSIQPNIRSFQCITTNIPKIPRTSQATTNVSTQTMGSAITINTNRASTAYKHDIYIKYSGDSSYGSAVATNVETSWTWTPAVSLASKIPNATGGTWNILVRTKSGSTTIGDKVINVTLNVPSNIVPSISSVGVAEATAGIAAQFAAYIQGRSTFKVTVAAAGNQGSTIKSYSVKADGKTYSGNSNVFTTQVINGAGTVNVAATVTDSRGRTASKTVSVTVTAYSSPSVSVFKAVRCTSAGVDSEEGTAVKITFNFAIAALGNKNTRSFKIQQLNGNAWTDIHVIADSYSTNSSIIKTGPFSVDSKFSFRAVAADFFTSATVYSDIAPSFALINFGASGKSLAFGGVSSNGGTFESYLPMWARLQARNGSWISGNTPSNSSLYLSEKLKSDSFTRILGMKTFNNHAFCVGAIVDRFGVFGFKSGRTENGYDCSTYLDVSNGRLYYNGNEVLSQANYPIGTKRWHYFFGGSSGKAEWLYLGHVSGSSDRTVTYIKFYTGNGYNGRTDQNSIINIMIKDGHQSTQAAANSQGVTWWCDGNYHNSIQVQVRATSHDGYQVWVYAPWTYWDGHYEVYTEATWNRSTVHQTSAPTGGVAQAVKNITPDMRGYPIGSVFECNAASISNPANVMGGTWQEIRAVFANINNSNQVIDVAGGATANGTNINLYVFNGSNAQKFLIQGSPAGQNTARHDLRMWIRTQ